MGTVCFLLVPHPLEELLLLLVHGSPNGLLGVPFLFFQWHSVIFLTLIISLQIALVSTGFV